MKHLIAALGLTVILSGCQTTVKDDVSEPVAKGDCIDTLAVAAYFGKDSPYWTDQQQQFCLESILLDVQGTEPEGAYRCTFDQGKFSTTGLEYPRIQSLPGGLMNAALAELVYYSFTAGAGFEPSGLSEPQPEGLMGQRYGVYPAATASGRTVSLYKNAATGQFELVRILDKDGVDWLAVSYNPRYHTRLNRMIPRKIDVFDIAQGVAAKKLIVQFEYVDIR